MENKEKLLFLIDLMTPEQIKTFLQLASLARYGNKSDLMTLAEIDQKSGKIDTAIPLEYQRQIENVYPNFKLGNMVFDYRNKFGEMLNLNDVIIKRFLNFSY